MSAQLRVGLVGCSARARATHVPALNSLPRSFRLTHVHDPDAPLAAELADQSGAVAATLAELVDGVDVAIIATPPHLRSRHLVTALRANVTAVLVDLPVALTSHEIVHAQRIASQSTSTVVVNAFHRYDPVWHQARAQFGETFPALMRCTAFVGSEQSILDVQATPMVEAAFDADGIYTTLSSNVVIGGLTGSAGTGAALAAARRSILHDLPLVRDVYGSEIQLLWCTEVGGGLEVVLRGPAGATIVMTEHLNTSARHEWRTELVAAEAHLRVDFSPAGLALDSSSYESTLAACSTRSPLLQDSGHRRTLK